MGNGNVTYKSKWVYILIAFIFGASGFQKLYAKRYGGYAFWIFLIIMLGGLDIFPLMYLIVFIDCIRIGMMSSEKFLIYCNKKYFKGMRKEEKLEEAERLLKRNQNVGTIISENIVKRDQPAIEVPGEEAHEDETHNHIKEDPKLASYVEKSQDKMDRFQNNNYFPSVDSGKIYDRKSRSERISELRQELKDGLVSKEEFNELVRKL